MAGTAADELRRLTDYLIEKLGPDMKVGEGPVDTAIRLLDRVVYRLDWKRAEQVLTNSESEANLIATPIRSFVRKQIGALHDRYNAEERTVELFEAIMELDS